MVTVRTRHRRDGNDLQTFRMRRHKLNPPCEGPPIFAAKEAEAMEKGGAITVAR